MLQKLLCHCSARELPSELMGSNRIFKIFNRKWSYDKMLIDWVRSGRTGKYLALGQEVQTSLRSVRTPWPRAKYFPVRPHLTQSIRTYSLLLTKFPAMLRLLFLTLFLFYHFKGNLDCLINEILSLKEQNPSLRTRRLTPFVRNSLFKEHCYHFIPFVIEPSFKLVLHIVPYS